jgi:hypothetical protein
MPLHHFSSRLNASQTDRAIGVIAPLLELPESSIALRNAKHPSRRERGRKA